jgi:hypothetical protein
LKPARVLAITVLLVAACTSPNSGSVHSPIPLSSPTPSPTRADSKAGDLRTRLNLLLSEHVMVVAKQAVAASNHNDEYAGYLSLLASNSNALVDVVRSAYGNTAATQFEQVWRIQDGYLIDYTIGLVTHNDAKSKGAMSGLVNGFVPQFAKLITSLTQLPVDLVTQLESQRLAEMKAMIDDEVAQSYAKMYPDLRTAYANITSLGNRLAIRMAQQFPDKFPGDPSESAIDTRVSLNNLLQEHSYLATMTTDAVVASRTSERNAAAASLGANAAELGKLFTDLLGGGAGTQAQQLWGARNADLIAYATSADVTARLGLTDKFITRFYAVAPTASDAARDQVTATIRVIDDQRAKASKSVAGDDRAAATGMQGIADRIF